MVGQWRLLHNRLRVEQHHICLERFPVFNNRKLTIFILKLLTKKESEKYFVISIYLSFYVRIFLGKGASKEERSESLNIAEKLIVKKNYSKGTRIQVSYCICFMVFNTTLFSKK